MSEVEKAVEEIINYILKALAQQSPELQAALDLKPEEIPAPSAEKPPAPEEAPVNVEDVLKAYTEQVSNLWSWLQSAEQAAAAAAAAGRAEARARAADAKAPVAAVAVELPPAIAEPVLANMLFILYNLPELMQLLVTEQISATAYTAVLRTLDTLSAALIRFKGVKVEVPTGAAE